ncbi:MAG: haloacid dehalogenase type II [Rhodospirillaceae bacterium]|nr:haloacid dehalogenase type II [Rhodospirillaceae bacterium]
MVKALFFDVFGTCIDWRSGIIREGRALERRLGLAGVDWAAFADAWRERYQPQLETVRNGSRPWVRLDVLHRESLDRVLAAFGLEAVPEAERAALNLAWHRLDPWPDVVPGLERLRRRYILAPVSNGHIAMMVNLARHAGLPWDAVLGAEIARAYKPQPEVYRASVEAAGLAPAEAMMVAAHAYDLAAAAACGLKTALVPRPDEYGPGKAADTAAAGGPWDVVAEDFVDLAARLGV